MNKLDLMTDEEVIRWIKKRISTICIILITLILLVYSRVINSLNQNLLDNFIVIAMLVYLISILSIKFFLDKMIFNVDGKKKSQIAKSIRDKYRK